VVKRGGFCGPHDIKAGQVSTQSAPIANSHAPSVGQVTNARSTIPSKSSKTTGMRQTEILFPVWYS